MLLFNKNLKIKEMKSREKFQYLGIIFTIVMLIVIMWSNFFQSKGSVVKSPGIVNMDVTRSTHFKQPSSNIISMDDVHKYEVNFADVGNPNFTTYLRNHWIYGPSKHDYDLELKNISWDRSQIGQTQFVNRLLRGKKNGFYIECGAANGEYLSNTLYFEKEKNWTGLLIEPNPKLFEEIIKKKRKAFIVNACLNTRNVSGRMEFKPSDVCGGLNIGNKRFGGGEVITVQCFPFYSLVLALNITHVDYFSLDVEGPELEILNTIPLKQIYIDIIGVEYRVVDPAFEKNEHFGPNRQKLKKIRDFFNATGLYKEVGILSENTVFNNEMDKERHGLDVFFRHV